MSRYRYTLTARTMVSAGQSDERSNVRRVHEIVPGATLRGAMAAAWWRSASTQQSDAATRFAALFDSGLMVGQAVPAGYELRSASARGCKYRTLPSCEAVLQDRGLTDRPIQWQTCWECGGPLASTVGWHRHPSAPVRVSSRTRGELDPDETAAEGKLFTRQGLVSAEKTIILTGELDAGEHDVSWLDGLSVRVGGARSLDYGAATLTLAPIEWPAWPGAGRHLLRLVSPTILVDEFGGAEVSVDALQRELRRVSGDAELAVSAQAGWLRSESVSGWHMRSRLPKVLDWAVAPGSVALIEGLTARGWDRLQRGIGLRSLEGYGQVEIVAPESLPPEPANQGVKLVRALPWLVREQKKRKSLIGTLTRLLERIQQDPAQADLIRQSATLGDLTGEAKGKALAILRIPAGHIPGTLDELRKRR